MGARHRARSAPGPAELRVDLPLREAVQMHAGPSWSLSLRATADSRMRLHGVHMHAGTYMILSLGYKSRHGGKAKQLAV